MITIAVLALCFAYPEMQVLAFSLVVSFAILAVLYLILVVPYFLMLDFVDRWHEARLKRSSSDLTDPATGQSRIQPD
jgi:hypothetical protein